MSPAKTKKTVGVIGLGIMGGSFSRNLVAAGWRVVGFDIDAGKRKELAKAGVEIVGSAKAVAAAAPIIITSLPKPEALSPPRRKSPRPSCRAGSSPNARPSRSRTRRRPRRCSAPPATSCSIAR